MNQFFGTQYSREDLQRRLQQRRERSSISRQTSYSSPDGPAADENVLMAGSNMMGGDSLDDIIMQNNKELQRRQSIPYSLPSSSQDARGLMMEFRPDGSQLDGFQFISPTGSISDAQLRRQSTSALDLHTDYSTAPISASQSRSAMSRPTNLAMNAGTQWSGNAPEMGSNMLGFTGMNLSDEPSSMDIWSPNPFTQNFPEPMINDYNMSMNLQDQIAGPNTAILPTDDGDDRTPQMPGLNFDDPKTTMVDFISSDVAPMPPNIPPTEMFASASVSTSATPAPAPALDSIPVSDIEGSVKVDRPVPPPGPQYQNIYSSSGFDMLGALMKVATRKNPEINIGKVDMSCAFVVCDVNQPDCPIIYCSDIFERLTGYTKHDVLGRNCRFLQSPEGKVQAGTPRKYCDNDSVLYLKHRISAKKEAQRSLINYRKGGQPFMNLLTMIPIPGDDDEDDIRYFVGFQVDLVEKPQSVEGKGTSGLYTVDYSQGMLPRYVWQPPENNKDHMDGGQTVSRDDVATLLTSAKTRTTSDLAKRMWDKALLENADDVVHVLSLKGLFLYLSPSSRNVLEYDSSELVGTALSSICHPSDIVPVTRELKDTSAGSTVNVVFRIRRKKSGYTWFESHGSLCVEQGKGRKCIILVGRERPVYALNRADIESCGGIGENEMWSKISTSGMFLFVSSNVRILLDRQAGDLIGTSIQALMRTDSRVEFGHSLEQARTGRRVTYKHDILNKRGLVLQASTTLYPGDAGEGEKPTFLVAQTRLLKTSYRSAASNPSAASPDGIKSLTSLNKADGKSNDSPKFADPQLQINRETGLPLTQAGAASLPIGTQDAALASEDNIFDELKTTRCTSWQFELRQMEKSNRLLAEELASLLSNKKKRKRRKGAGNLQRDCANCHTRVTPEWRRGPSGHRDLCNSCGLRWAKQTGRLSRRNSARGTGDSGSKNSASPVPSSPLQASKSASPTVASLQHDNSFNPNLNPNPNPPNPGTSIVDGAIMEGSNIPPPAILGGRTTQESMPVHAPSMGFRHGGERGITNIDEMVETE